MAAVFAAPLISASNGYLPLVGPKPLVFGRAPVPVALAIAKLPALIRETPHATNGAKPGPVILPPPGPHEDVHATAAASQATNTISAASGHNAAGTGVAIGDAGHPAVDPTGVGGGIDPATGLPFQGSFPAADSSLPLLSPQMLVPFFRSPGVTNRTMIVAPVQFTPAQPAPAASSTATYEQH